MSQQISYNKDNNERCRKVLVIAGTGTMGVHVVNLLRERGDEVWVTSRLKRQDTPLVHYLQGTPLNLDFLKQTMALHQWDSVIDFMYYQTSEFTSVIDTLLLNTKQYIYISSARVYADTNERIKEDFPRILDVCKDEDYLNSDEYALAKAREEDILKHSGKRNWTIVRPYITFGDNTFQLSPIRKEYWLYRALKGKKILFSKDLAEKMTTFTYGYNVAQGIVAIACNEKTYGEAYHIASPYSQTWSKILEIYLDVLESYLNKRPQVCYIEKWTPLLTGTAEQVKYDRLYNRTFDNTKLDELIDTKTFECVEDAIKKCLNTFFHSKPTCLDIYAPKEAMMDRVTGDWESLKYLIRRPILDIIRYYVYRIGLRS